jgi:hypothetical protein
VTERIVALIGALESERVMTQTIGHPLAPEKMLPVADVLLLVADADPGAMLFRYTAHGDFGGDTWHASVEEAQEQAAYEYGDALGVWIQVPDDIADPHEFAVRYAFERLDSR